MHSAGAKFERTAVSRPYFMTLKFISNLVPVLAFAIVFTSCSAGSESRRLREGSEIINKVENFKKDKGRLPNSLSELGIEEKLDGPIYYNKRSDTKYVVWFGTSLGESVTYDSDSKKWEPINK